MTTYEFAMGMDFSYTLLHLKVIVLKETFNYIFTSYPFFLILRATI